MLLNKYLLIQSNLYSNKIVGIFSMLIDPGAPGQAYVVGIICHLPDMIRINALAKYWWEPIPTSLLPIRSGALADHSFFEKMLFDKSYVFS